MLREKAPRNFNPRAPCGARRLTSSQRLTGKAISIHAPRVGRDTARATSAWSSPAFQSTRPVWGATLFRGRPCSRRSYFNPRAPCGARLRKLTARVNQVVISIHAPRVGRDMHTHPIRQIGDAFQSTRPVWGATVLRDALQDAFFISIHAPRVGRDLVADWICHFSQISIHAPRVGRDSKFDDFTPSNLHKRYKRVLARPKNTREKGKIKQKLAYIHAFSAFLGCEGSGTFCALVLRTQYR